VSDAASAPVDLLVRDADLLVTMDGPDRPGGWVACRDGRVAGIGPAGAEPPARQVLSAAGCLVTPGLVNAHHHLFQNLTRAYAPAAGDGLEAWLGKLRPLWLRLDEEGAYVSAWVGLAELARNGCTTTADHLYLHPRPKLTDATIAAAGQVGLRFHPVRGSTSLVEDDDAVLDDVGRLLALHAGPVDGAMVRVGAGPTSLGAGSPRLLRELAALTIASGGRLHTHLLETAGEAAWSRAELGLGPVEALVAAGWGEGDAWVAHGVHADERDVDELARASIGVAHCPSSNLLLGAGVAPVRSLLDAGVDVGLGCDGSSSSDSGSLWLEARTAYLSGSLRDGPGAHTGRGMLELATTGSARCLGRDDLGRLAVGGPADLAAFELDPLAFAGAHTDLVEAWVRCGPVTARHTVVAGRPVVRDGQLVAAGLPEILADHRRLSLAMQGAPT
jgi:8-oxoguanine deaminase